MGVVDAAEWAYVLCGHCIQNDWVEQRICIKFCIELQYSSGNYSDDSEGHSSGQLLIGSFIMTMHLLMHHVCAEFFGETSNYPGDSAPPTPSPNMVPNDYWLFPNLKSPLKGKRFQTIDEIQENRTVQLMATGRTVWGPKVPTLKGTEALLSCIQCFLYLASSSINVSISPITWLDTFWTEHIYLSYIFISIYLYIWSVSFYIQHGAKVGLQFFIMKIIQSLINNNTRINFHVLTTVNLLLPTPPCISVCVFIPIHRNSKYSGMSLWKQNNTVSF